MTLRRNGLDKMIFILILMPYVVTSEIITSYGPQKACLTGYMTDLQSWVDKGGRLKMKRTMDMSGIKNPLSVMSHIMNNDTRTMVYKIKYLSMAMCGLQRIPAVFSKKDDLGRSLAETLEYVTFFGNNFAVIGGNNYAVRLNATNAIEMRTNDAYPTKQFIAWGNGFIGVVFKSLKELDLRACAIQTVGTNIFYKMTTLKSIYLSENNIFYIEPNTFSRLTNLKHLDLSRNFPLDHNNRSKSLIFETVQGFEGLKIESLDFSYTPLDNRNLPLIRTLGKYLKRLSLCYSGITRLKSDAFNGTSIKYLDLSGNNEVLHTQTALRGLEDTLEVLYAKDIGMKNMDSLLNLSNLEILKLPSNQITAVPQNVAATLKNLQVLDLSHNRLISWFTRIFSLMPHLKLLLLNYNNINIVSHEMYNDIENITYFGLSNNFVVCSCYVRDIFEVGLRSETVLTERPLIELINNNSYEDYIPFHTGLNDFNKIILNGYNLSNTCDYKVDCEFDLHSKLIGNYFLLFDNDLNNPFQCLLASEGKTTNINRVLGCSKFRQEFDLQERTEEGWKKIFFLIIPTLLLPCVLFAYIYRKNFRYFLITIRNSTMLSLISKDDVTDESTIFNYDVFISYCNEDRGWVLDNLLPHVERDCNISVCLHERDFQVGLSILENIVSCMDRSRSIMLIISKRFLLSQWCQFEMHLAQHRLLETRREDLILVLLEEIPRRLRPNTLHYLMLTKTYIVWPVEETEQSLFWKRMNKSIVTLKSKHSENVSLA